MLYLNYKGRSLPFYTIFIKHKIIIYKGDGILPKKLTIEQVRFEFSKVGYLLLEETYSNSHVAMRFKCPNHPNKETFLSLHHLKRGQRCKYCIGKIDYNDAAFTFRQRGYILLEKDYKTSNTKMRYQCLIHSDKELYISYDRLRRGEGCPYCAGNVRLEYDFVKSEFKKRGYELLENEYKDSHTKMKYKCTYHPNEDLSITYGDLKQGYGCRHCFEDSRRENFDTVKNEFEDRGYILLSEKEEYKNFNSELKYTCPLHPDRELKIKYGRLKEGGGCPFCGGYAKPTIEELRIEFKQRGYILLEEVYIGTLTKMKFKCLKHINEDLEITYHSFKEGHGCKFCGKEKSIEKRKGENHSSWKGGVTEITEFLRKRLKEWKLISLEKFNFRCAITNEWNTDLHIHHPKPFYKVRDEIFEELGMPIYQTVGEYTQEQLNIIVEKLKEKHNEFIGIPLRKHIHELFHSLYGYDTTYEDFCQFRERYISGEFFTQ
jgi:hypothetical protein